MKIVVFSQGTEEWLQWRRSGVGASDIGVLTGTNRHDMTPLKLWEIKCGFREEETPNRAMQHGIDNEERARIWLNQNFQLDLQPLCIEDIEKSHYKASLDGYDVDHETLCEIKCPISEKVLDKFILEQAVPNQWFDQMQWQMMLCKPKRAFIAVWDYRNNCCYTLDQFPNRKSIAYMQKLADDFWRKVQTGKAPDADPTKDFIKIEDEDLHIKLVEYQNIASQESALQMRKRELRDEIIRYGNGGSFSAHGFKVQRVDARVSYDIEKMKLDGINVDLYIKKSDEMEAYRIYSPK
jgi:putative phage-type endonuclease